MLPFEDVNAKHLRLVVRYYELLGILADGAAPVVDEGTLFLHVRLGELQRIDGRVSVRAVRPNLEALEVQWAGYPVDPLNWLRTVALCCLCAWMLMALPFVACCRCSRWCCWRGMLLLCVLMLMM